MTSPKGLLLCSVALLPAALVSCAHPTYRQITAEHWHDKDTVVIAYTDFARKGNVLYSPVTSTAHILVCRVARDNSVTCREQPLADRVLAGQPTARMMPPSRPTTAGTTAPAAAKPPRPPAAGSPAVPAGVPTTTEPPPETASTPDIPRPPSETTGSPSSLEPAPVPSAAAIPSGATVAPAVPASEPNPDTTPEQ